MATFHEGENLSFIRTTIDITIRISCLLYTLLYGTELSAWSDLYVHIMVVCCSAIIILLLYVWSQSRHKLRLVQQITGSHTTAAQTYLAHVAQYWVDCVGGGGESCGLQPRSVGP